MIAQDHPGSKSEPITSVWGLYDAIHIQYCPFFCVGCGLKIALAQAEREQPQASQAVEEFGQAAYSLLPERGNVNRHKEDALVP